MSKIKSILFTTLLALIPLQVNANHLMAPIISYLLSGSSDNIAPVFIMSTTRNINEKQMSAIRLEASDSSSVTYSISGGDSNSLNVNTLTGAVTFKVTTNYDTKKTYTFTAKATDTSFNETTQNIIINILNINDSPIKYEKTDVDSDGYIDFITARYYDTSNRLIKETRSVYGAKPETTKEYTYMHDILVDKKEIYGNSGILHYNYNNAGVIQTVSLESFDGSGSSVIADYTYEDNLLTSQYYTRDYTVSDNKTYYKKTYSYTADRKVLRMEKVNLTNDSLMYSIDKTYSNSLLTKEVYTSSSYTYAFTYTADNVITVLDMEVNGKLYRTTRGTEKQFSYSISNLINYISNFDDDKTINLGRYETREDYSLDSGSLIKKTVYTYNSNGDRLYTNTYDEDNTISSSGQYSYNDHNDLILYENYYYDELKSTNTYDNSYVNNKLVSTLTTMNNTKAFYKEYDEMGFITLSEIFYYNFTFGNKNRYDFYNPYLQVKYQKATWNNSNNLFLITSNMCDIDGDSTMDINIDYTWNNAGKILQVKQADNYFNTDNIRIKNYQYDSSNFLTSFEVINDNPSYSKNTDFTIFYESADTAVEHEFSKLAPNSEYVTLLITHDNETDKDTLQQRFIYDTQDRLIRTISYQDRNIDTIVDITFNDDNQVIRKFTHSGMNYHNNTYEINSTYNDDNTLHTEVHSIENNNQGINTVDTYSYSYIYTDSTKEVTTKLDEGSNGSIDQTSNSIYDLNNKLLSDGINSDSANHYEYDEQGKLTKKIRKANDESWSRIMESYTYSGTYLQKALYITSCPDSYSAAYNSVTYIYDSNNLLIKTLNDTCDDGSIQSEVNYYYVK